MHTESRVRSGGWSRRGLLMVLAAPLLALVAAAPGAAFAEAASAGPSVSIVTPEEDATISRAVSPTIVVAGEVAAEEPVAVQRQFFLRRTACSLNTADKRLSIVRGEETVGCAPTVSTTPENEVWRVSTEYPARDGVPLTLDTSRPLTGVVTHLNRYFSAAEASAGAGVTSIDITVTAEKLGGGTETLGETTVSYVATPLEREHSEPWSIELPARLDKTDFAGLSLTLVVRGVNALHGYTKPNDTHLTVPTWSASFADPVVTVVDNATGATKQAELSGDGTRWTAEFATSPPGEQVFKAWATQGYTRSPFAHRTITVTD